MKRSAKKASVTTAMHDADAAERRRAGRRVIEERVRAKDAEPRLHREEEPEPDEPRDPEERRAVARVRSRRGARATSVASARVRSGSVVGGPARGLGPLRARRERPEDRERPRTRRARRASCRPRRRGGEARGPTRTSRSDEARDADEEEREHRAVHDDGEPVLPRPEERVGDVAAVELADGEQVDHRDEDARPGAERDRRELRTTMPAGAGGAAKWSSRRVRSDSPSVMRSPVDDRAAMNWGCAAPQSVERDGEARAPRAARRRRCRAARRACGSCRACG